MSLLMDISLPPKFYYYQPFLEKKKVLATLRTHPLIFKDLLSETERWRQACVFFTGTDIARNLLFRKLCCGECAGHSRLPFPTPALYRNWTPWLRFHSRHEPRFEQGSDRIPRPFGTLPGEAGLEMERDGLVGAQNPHHARARGPWQGCREAASRRGQCGGRGLTGQSWGGRDAR